MNMSRKCVMLSEICMVKQSQKLDSTRVRRIITMNIEVTGDDKVTRCSRHHKNQSLKIFKELKKQ